MIKRKKQISNIISLLLNHSRSRIKLVILFYILGSLLDVFILQKLTSQNIFNDINIEKWEIGSSIISNIFIQFLLLLVIKNILCVIAIKWLNIELYEFHKTISLKLFKTQIFRNFDNWHDENQESLIATEPLVLTNQFYRNIISIFLDGILLVSYAMVMLINFVEQSMLIGLLLTGVYFLIKRKQNHKLKLVGRERVDSEETKIKIINSVTSHAPDIQSQGLNEKFLKLFEKNQIKNSTSIREKATLMDLIKHENELILVFIGLTTILLTYLLSGMERTIMFLSVLGFIFFRINPILNKLNVSLQSIFNGIPTFDKIYHQLMNINELNNIKKIEIDKYIKITFAKTKNLNDKIIIESKSIELTPGKIYSITGESGSGKSTLLKKIFYGDASIKINTKCQNSFIRGLVETKNTTFIGQFGFILPGSLHENIGLEEPEQPLLSKMYRDIEMESLKANISNENLSGGQLQRISLIRALRNKEKSIFLIDEPTNAIQESLVNEIIEVLDNMAQENIVIVVSHDVKLIEKTEQIIRL